MLKKGLAVLLVMIFAVTVLVAPVSAINYYSYIKIVNLVIGQKTATINGVKQVMDQPAFVKNGRTLVPFRFLGEALGAQVSWDGGSKTATLMLTGNEVKVVLGSKAARINNAAASLDVPAESIGGRTFIPLRFVSEAFDAHVDYDAPTKTVTITLVDTTDWKEFTEPVTGNPIIYPNDWRVNDATNTLNITSPQGSTLIAEVIQGNPIGIVAAKKNKYLQNGFVLESDDPVDTAKPTIGRYVTLVKENKLDKNKGVICTIVVIKADKGIFVAELLTTVSASDQDLTVMKFGTWKRLRTVWQV
jgi:hypothetical protein